MRGQDQGTDGRSTSDESSGAYDQAYLSNSPEAWRRLGDIALSWRDAGQRLGDTEMANRGAAIAQRASLLFEGSRRGIERSWLEKEDAIGMPIVAGSSQFYWETPYRTSPASFDENRVCGPSCSTQGYRPDKRSRSCWTSPASGTGPHWGSSTTGCRVVGFLVAEAVQGLLQHDLVPEALLVFYAHAFHAHTRGTWTAIECVDMDRDRAFHSPFCAPAQMTVPTVAKWLLVYEEPLDRVITLGQGAPRTWLEDGKQFGVDGAPTRWGPISYRVRSRLSEGKIDAEISLPPGPGAIVQRRRRCPPGHKPTRVVAIDHKHLEPRITEGTVRLPAGTSGKVRLEVSCSATDVG